MSLSDPRVVVYVKPGCHLCEDAVVVVSSVCSDWIARDITGDAELMAQWAEYVPVILVDGEVHDVFRANPDRLRAALSG